MVAKRNDEVKEFAIGTKIEHNGKLYEVVKGNYCDDCAIANICANNDVYSNNEYDDVLSRDQRLNIFGDCSNINRADNTSIVFKEVPMNKSDNINHDIIQPLVEPDGTIKDLQIKAPYNYEIDIENSDLSKGIVKFKNKWMSIEDIYKLMVKDRMYCYRNIVIKGNTDSVLMAIANLIDIASYFNKNWHYDPTKEDVGYMITYDNSVKESHYVIDKINGATDVYYGNPIFREESAAKYVIDNPKFRYMLDKIFNV